MYKKSSQFVQNNRSYYDWSFRCQNERYRHGQFDKRGYNHTAFGLVAHLKKIFPNISFKFIDYFDFGNFKTALLIYRDASGKGSLITLDPRNYRWLIPCSVNLIWDSKILSSRKDVANILKTRGWAVREVNAYLNPLKNKNSQITKCKIIKTNLVKCGKRKGATIIIKDFSNIELYYKAA